MTERLTYLELLDRVCRRDGYALVLGAQHLPSTEFAYADDRRRGRIDWSTAAARGELLHLDWSDKRDDRP